MTTSNKQKAELGIYWFSYDLYDNGVDDLSAYLVKPEPAGDNIILVKTIDYNRYVELEQKLAKAVAALRFYADPNSYFGIALLPDPPCGDFIKDFDEVYYEDIDENVFRPGKIARETLASLGESEVGEG